MSKSTARNVVLAVILIAIPSASWADRSVRACIGEYDNECNFSHDVFFPCGTSFEAAARSICTVVVSGGQRKVLQYEYAREGQRSGNACGYQKFLVTCYGR